MKKLMCILCLTLMFPLVAQAQGPIKKNELIDLQHLPPELCQPGD